MRFFTESLQVRSQFDSKQLSSEPYGLRRIRLTFFGPGNSAARETRDLEAEKSKGSRFGEVLTSSSVLRHEMGPCFFTTAHALSSNRNTGETRVLCRKSWKTATLVETRRFQHDT